MDKMPSWELNNCSTGQKIPFLVWNLQSNFYVHKNHHRTLFWASKIHSAIQYHISLWYYATTCTYVPMSSLSSSSSYCDFECISHLPFVGYMSLPISSFLILMVDFVQMWWTLIFTRRTHWVLLNQHLTNALNQWPFKCPVRSYRSLEL
jgi:hypothetical protein